MTIFPYLDLGCESTREHLAILDTNNVESSNDNLEAFMKLSNEECRNNVDPMFCERVGMRALVGRSLRSGGPRALASESNRTGSCRGCLAHTRIDELDCKSATM